MISLLLAICFSFTMSLMMRVMSRHIQNPMAMYMSNYFVCILLALFYAGKVSFTAPGMIYPFVIGGISGALYLLSLQAYDSNISVNGLSMAATFNKLGIIIPEILAFAVFGETAAWNQIVGMVIAIGAIVYMYFDQESMKKIAKKGMLVYLLLVAGICDSMGNIYNTLGPAELKDVFLLFNFGFAFMFSAVTLVMQRKKFTVKDCMVGALIGIPNYMSSRFILYALASLSAVIVYPVYNVTVLLMLIISGVIFFKEEMNAKKAVTTLLVCTALVLLNITL